MALLQRHKHGLAASHRVDGRGLEQVVERIASAALVGGDLARDFGIDVQAGVAGRFFRVGAQHEVLHPVVLVAEHGLAHAQQLAVQHLAGADDQHEQQQGDGGQADQPFARLAAEQAEPGWGVQGGFC
jgi:hypothetical protein